MKVENDASRRVKEAAVDAVEGAPAHGVSAPAAEAKDAGWEDLDAEDNDDPLMVAEYVNEIFDYMKEIEVSSHLAMQVLGIMTLSNKLRTLNILCLSSFPLYRQRRCQMEATWTRRMRSTGTCEVSSSTG